MSRSPHGKNRFNLGVMGKFNVLSITLILATAVSLAAYEVRREFINNREELLRQGSTIISMLAMNSEYAVFSEDDRALQTVVNSLDSGDIEYVAIYNAERKVLKERVFCESSRIPPLEAGNLDPSVESRREVVGFGKHRDVVDFVVPIVNRSSDFSGLFWEKEAVGSPNEAVGFVQMGLCMERFHKEIEEFIISMVLLTGLLIVGGVGVTLILTRRIAGPIKSLAAVAHRIADGDLSQEIADIHTRDEINELAGAFKVMVQNLSQYREEVNEHRRTLEDKVRQRTVELQAAMEEAQLLARQATEASRAKSQFLANMSHEIRTPMNGILGMSEILLGSDLKNNQKNCAKTILNSAENLLGILNDILDFSKIEAGKLELEDTVFDVHDCIEGTLELFAERAHKKGLELLCRLSDDIPRKLVGDVTRFRQIFMNLVGNAVKFTDNGEVLTVAFLEESEESGCVLRIEVRDTGIGLDPHHVERIFDAFSQADGSTTRKYGGTGLGLAIVKQLCVAMGGSIQVESVPREGSVFTLILPFKRLQERQDSLEPARRIMPGLNILIVDDNETNRSILQHQLSGWHIRNDAAASGREALDLMRRAGRSGRGYDIAVLDLMMPEMDGMDLARHIKADPTLSGVKLIMLTSLGVHGEAQEARGAGISIYLTKPVRQSSLYNSITDLAMAKKEPSICSSQLVEPSPNPGSFEAKILVAEDNPVNQEVCKQMLETLGCQVHLVSNGVEALRALSIHSFDLVFMDCQMPEMDGYEAVRTLRNLETEASDGSRHQIIVALTAHAMEGDRDRCIAAGMDDYLSKPFNRKQLQETLGRWLPCKGADQEGEPGRGKTSQTDPRDSERESEPGAQHKTESAGKTVHSNAHIDRGIWEDILSIEQSSSPGLLNRVLSIYVQSSEDAVARLKEATFGKNLAELCAVAHSLKSSSATVGAMNLSWLCAEMEQKIREGREKRLDGLLDQIEAEYLSVRQIMSAELEQSSS
jgi:signal transduction histidine kinase/DNA-binding response OmpR family regulator/HPt (histidine-containing phosphotransfer) domain-containing protein